MKNCTALSEEEHDRNGAAEASPDARWAVIDERLDDTQYIEWRPVGALASLSASLHQRKKGEEPLSTTEAVTSAEGARWGNWGGPIFIL